MTDDVLYERMLDSMEAFFGRVAERTIGPDGVLAAVTPSIPDRSVFNSVVYRDPEALLAARDELEAAYLEAGVQAWTVWTPEGDTAMARGLEAAGHVLDAWPEAMAAPLADLDVARGAEGLDWERGPQLIAEMCSVLEEAFHWPAGPAARRMAWMEEVYVARDGGVPVACVAAMHVDGDCAIWNVGTREAARGRGLATGLMRQALLDAREAGCETTTLQATQLGRPVYRRVGYRELGALQMWERRRS
ncbi:MAG TPA: GNAT family N-acetyltransferase [Solirubrobacteraceae bacterium]|nr:GNAT family N-acetyltransferase [Solirubrobacteraceae bacterium]